MSIAFNYIIFFPQIEHESKTPQRINISETKYEYLQIYLTTTINLYNLNMIYTYNFKG